MYINKIIKNMYNIVPIQSMAYDKKIRINLTMYKKKTI